MARSIAQMRASGGVSLPERTVTLYLNQALVAKAQALEDERATLEEAHEEAVERAKRAAADPSRKSVSKVVAPEPPQRIAEIGPLLDAIRAEMSEYRADVRLRCEPAGAWRRWADDNPAREGNVTDNRVGFGVVDTTALLARLGGFMLTCNDDELADDERAYVLENAAPSGLMDACKEVVMMQEAGHYRPKASPTPSSDDQTSESA